MSQWDAPQHPMLGRNLNPRRLLSSSSVVRANKPRRSDSVAEGCWHGWGWVPPALLAVMVLWHLPLVAVSGAGGVSGQAAAASTWWSPQCPVAEHKKGINNPRKGLKTNLSHSPLKEKSLIWHGWIPRPGTGTPSPPSPPPPAPSSSVPAHSQPVPCGS